jgi:hypothetical protein
MIISLVMLEAPPAVDDLARERWSADRGCDQQQQRGGNRQGEECSVHEKPVDVYRSRSPAPLAGMVAGAAGPDRLG